MLLVKTYVGPSPIEGVGVFAAEDIKKGQLIYRFDPLFDKLVPKSLIETGPEHLAAFVKRYGYPYNLDPTMFVIDLDHGRYMNHQDLPNTDFTGVTDGFATRDIKAGEEITCNYNEFEPDHQMEPSFVTAFQQVEAAQQPAPVIALRATRRAANGKRNGAHAN